MYIRITVLLLALAVFGCKSRTAPEPPVTETPTPPVDPPTKEGVCAAITMGEAGESDPLSSMTTHINGNCLEMKVTYGGGCKTHEFELVWSGAHAESMPPQASVFLVHKNNGDNCRAIKSEKVTFDLEKLKYNGTGQVILNISTNGVPMQRANYTY